jgi:hypothetical protein
MIEHPRTLQFYICKTFQTYVGQTVQRDAVLFGKCLCVSKALEPSRFRFQYGRESIQGNVASAGCYLVRRGSEQDKWRLFRLRHISFLPFFPLK